MGEMKPVEICRKHTYYINRAKGCEEKKNKQMWPNIHKINYKYLFLYALQRVAFTWGDIKQGFTRNYELNITTG